MLGQVVGQLVATRKHEALTGHKLLVVRPYGLYQPAHAVDLVVALDFLGAGPGEDVVVCFGEPARRCSRLRGRTADTDRPLEDGGAELPVEAAVMAIVDRIDLSREVVAGLKRPLAFHLGGQRPAGAAELPPTAGWT